MGIKSWAPEAPIELQASNSSHKIASPAAGPGGSQPVGPDVSGVAITGDLGEKNVSSLEQQPLEWAGELLTAVGGLEGTGDSIGYNWGLSMSKKQGRLEEFIAWCSTHLQGQPPLAG